MAQEKTQTIDRLDGYDRDYFFKTKKLMEQKAEIMNNAQNDFALAQQNFQGFAVMVKDKYGLELEDEIKPDGEIIRKG